jgi:hypothetical protein
MPTPDSTGRRLVTIPTKYPHPPPGRKGLFHPKKTDYKKLRKNKKTRG